MDEVERVSDKIAIIDNGKIIMGAQLRS